MQVWNVLQAAGSKYRMRKLSNLLTIAQRCRVISSQLTHVSTTGKKWLNSNIFSTYPHNMTNFGPLTAYICWRVRGTQQISTVFTTTFNRGRHVHSAGRPSRWASSHIPVLCYVMLCYVMACVRSDDCYLDYWEQRWPYQQGYSPARWDWYIVLACKQPRRRT